MRPARFASYIALSAAASNAAASLIVESGIAATPTLMVTGMLLPPNTNARRSIADAQPLGDDLDAGQIGAAAQDANSSPPKRASTSSARSIVVSIADSSDSTKSPAGWPWVSLIVLK